MERIRGKFIVLIMLIIIPFYAFALETSKSSDIISTSSSIVIEMNVEKVHVKSLSFAKFSDLYNSGKPGFTVSGILYNDFDRVIDVNFSLYLYDNNKNIVKEYNNKYTLKIGEEIVYSERENYMDVDNLGYYSAKLTILTDISTPKKKKENINRDYYIEELNNIVKISKDRNVYYDESIKMIFSKDKNYYYRNIPRYHIYVIDNTNSNNNYKLSLEKGLDILKLGNSNNKFKKEDLIKINYSYNYGIDYSKEYDEVIVPIINNYDSLIKNANVIIDVPSINDIKGIEFYKNNKKINTKHKIENNKFVVSYNNLDQGDIIKTRLIFNNGYFIDTKGIIDIILRLGIVLPIIFLLVMLIIVFIVTSGKRKARKFNITKLREYSSLEVGYLYNDYLDDKDIMSLIINLANDGYLQIEKRKDEFLLIRDNDYKGDNEVYKELLDGIFNNRYIVKETDLYNKDVSFIKNIKKQINDKYKVRFYNNLFNRYSIVLIINYICLLLVTYRVLVTYDKDYLNIGLVVSSIIYLILVIISNSNLKIIEKTIAYLSLLVIYTFLLYSIIIPGLKISILYISVYVIGIISVIINIVLYKLIHKRKRKYNKLLANINRFRDNILRKKKIDNGMFMYLLPYTYSIDIYDEYTDLFDNIDKPTWYICSKYDYKEFVKDIKELLARITYDLVHDIEKR